MDDPVTCALYGKEHKILDEPEWERFKKLAHRQKKMIRMVQQAKLNSFQTVVVYKYGFRVPRNHDQVMEYDQENGNTRWRDSKILEVEQLHEYSVFGDKGYGGSKPAGYKMIQCHLVYNVKHDAKHKSRLVAGGHLTDTPLNSMYSRVVSSTVVPNDRVSRRT
jgi:hypothetical protein